MALSQSLATERSNYNPKGVNVEMQEQTPMYEKQASSRLWRPFSRVTDDSKNSSEIKHVDSMPPYPKTRSSHIPTITYVVRWLIVSTVVGCILCIPILVFRTTLDLQGNSDVQLLVQAFNEQYQNLVFWIFCWILVTWLSACVFHFIALIFPYVFRYVAKYINPAHRRYWRVFHAMKWPITILGCLIGSYIGYALLIFQNENMVANYDFNSLNNSTVLVGSNTTFNDSGKATVALVEEVLNDVLFNLILWAALYFVEKTVIVYISIHFHYRSNFNKIKDAKRTIKALTVLYDASVLLHPLYKSEFQKEDYIIHDTRDSPDGRIRPIGKASRFASMGARSVTSAFGYLIKTDEQSHWFQPGSTYAIVSRALNHPSSAAALAKRIWVSLATHGKDSLTVDDIAAVLGPHRNAEAQEIFTLLDDNENGDIRLNELVPLLVEIGNTRRNVYAGMHDVDHALNTFDWVLCLILAVGMIFFILISWVPQIKSLRDNLALIVVGGAFIVGRIGHEFFSGAIFILFKHVFDIGDHVKLYNNAENRDIACIVKRMSLLYVIFERVDNGMLVQIQNDRLGQKTIENLSRSGINREMVDLPVDFNTTFKDIQQLREELYEFVTRKENTRDYQPRLDVHVKSIHDMTKMELRCSFWHKSNWSNEELRAARSSKFLCALIAAVRKVPIGKPGGNGAKVGEEGKPAYYVMVSEDDAAKKRTEEKTKQLEKRSDFVKPDPKPEPSTNIAETDAADEAARKEKEAEEAKRAEEDAFVSMIDIPVVQDDSINPIQRVDSSAFMFISGSETGTRRRTVASEAPFTPWT